GAESEILWGRAYGGVYLVEELAKILGIRDVLRGALKRSKIASPVEQGIVGMIANRCIAQQSKLRVDEWLKEDVYFPKAEEIRLQHLYRGMDFLESNKDMIEKDLYLKTRDLFNRRVDIVFYNITTIYIEGRGEEESFQYGYRPDRKQVVVGLSVDRDGLPLSSMLFSGSTIDAKTIDEMIGRLSGLEVGRVVFVCDRGMVSEENLKLIESAGYGYLVGVKLRELKAVRDEVLSVKGRFQKVSEKLEVKDVEVGGRRYIVCYNPQEAERDKAIRDEVIRELEAEIEKINKGSLSACVVKDSALKRRYVRELKTGKLTLDRAKIRQESLYDGKYVLLTTERELSAGELALQYKNLFRVERAFRVELCPIYHRVKAHLTLCVLS
ncbi:MAG: IS1634 family transposase, partial [Nitrospirae bacterium]